MRSHVIGGVHPDEGFPVIVEIQLPKALEVTPLLIEGKRRAHSAIGHHLSIAVEYVVVGTKIHFVEIKARHDPMFEPQIQIEREEVVVAIRRGQMVPARGRIQLPLAGE